MLNVELPASENDYARLKGILPFAQDDKIVSSTDNNSEL